MGRVSEGWGDMRGHLRGARMCCVPAGQAITCTKASESQRNKGWFPTWTRLFSHKHKRLINH